MAIYTGDAVRMAYLATYGGSHVNGVAELHSQLLKDVTLKNFSDVYPDKFTNVTNGVTPRRFVKLANRACPTSSPRPRHRQVALRPGDAQGPRAAGQGR